jgi:hypothetical protein
MQPKINFSNFTVSLLNLSVPLTINLSPPDNIPTEVI